MTILTEGRHTAEFILSEANGRRSRENGTVKSGEILAAGQLVQLDTGKLVAFDGATDSAGDLVVEATGIILGPVDASATGTNADTPAAYLARDAEVNDNVLVFPTETSGGNEHANAVASLALLGILVR